MATRRASVVWEGGFKSGRGNYRGESGGLQGDYTAGSRFEEEKGSNPEELLAAAEASCFAMALSGNLERNGTPPERIEADAACTVEKFADGYRITTMKLDVRATVPNIEESKFQEIAATTFAGCPVSRVFAGNVDMQLDAQLESPG